MSRYSSVTLDLSRFPAPLAIRGIDYEKILAERKVKLLQIFDAKGIPYDAATLEVDPAVALQQADAFREELVYSSINDVFLSGMVAFSTGPDLDHIGLTGSLNLPVSLREAYMRRVILPATEFTPAVMERDEEYRRRLLMGPEAFSSAGSLGGYVFHALWADSRVLNVDVWSPAAGEVMVAIQSRIGDGTAPTDLINAVRAHLRRDDIKPLTDVVTVRSIVNIPYAVSLDAFVLPGPDPTAVKIAIEEQILKSAAARRTPARDMPLSAIYAAAQIDIVDKVILSSPLVDIARDYGEVPTLASMDVRVQTYAG